MSQKPYRANTVTIPNGETDFPILEEAFGDGWLQTLQGAPSNIVLQFSRDIQYRLGSVDNDLIDALNATNSNSILRFQDIQTWWTDTLSVPEIYVTNNSGQNAVFQIQIYANRFK